MNPALMAEGDAEVMRYLGSYLKSKPLILGIPSVSSGTLDT
jgi:hypothetical protein